MQVCLRLPTGTPKGVRPARRSPIPSSGPVVAHVRLPSAQGSPFPFRLTVLPRYCLRRWHRRIRVSSRDPSQTKENKTTKRKRENQRTPKTKPETARDV